MRKLIIAMLALGLALITAGSPALADGETATATFYVPATAGGGTHDLGGEPWFDTGLVFVPGTVITLSANGVWFSCRERGCVTTANGIGVRQVTDCAFIAPDLSVFSLIATTGAKAPVFVGVGPTMIRGGGRLRLAINDCYFGDNVGGFNVTVTYPTAAVTTDEDVAA